MWGHEVAALAAIVGKVRGICKYNLGGEDRTEALDLLDEAERLLVAPNGDSDQRKKWRDQKRAQRSVRVDVPNVQEGSADTSADMSAERVGVEGVGVEAKGAQEEPTARLSSSRLRSTDLPANLRPCASACLVAFREGAKLRASTVVPDDAVPGLRRYLPRLLTQEAGDITRVAARWRAVGAYLRERWGDDEKMRGVITFTTAARHFDSYEEQARDADGGGALELSPAAWLAEVEACEGCRYTAECARATPREYPCQVHTENKPPWRDFAAVVKGDAP